MLTFSEFLVEAHATEEQVKHYTAMVIKWFYGQVAMGRKIDSSTEKDLLAAFQWCKDNLVENGVTLDTPPSTLYRVFDDDAQGILQLSQDQINSLSADPVNYATNLNKLLDGKHFDMSTGLNKIQSWSDRAQGPKNYISTNNRWFDRGFKVFVKSPFTPNECVFYYKYLDDMGHHFKVHGFPYNKEARDAFSGLYRLAREQYEVVVDTRQPRTVEIVTIEPERE